MVLLLCRQKDWCDRNISRCKPGDFNLSVAPMFLSLIYDVTRPSNRRLTNPISERCRRRRCGVKQLASFGIRLAMVLLLSRQKDWCDRKISRCWLGDFNLSVAPICRSLICDVTRPSNRRLTNPISDKCRRRRCGVKQLASCGIRLALDLLWSRQKDWCDRKISRCKPGDSNLFVAPMFLSLIYDVTRPGSR
ncbi:hypothetical protein Rcae01_00121 [Novipirellula caenicola]|uniref:Uncharacterized protein n=1 Tax=Novipirellula caenicola TaxID=1536901 RepID=A0ABP9VLX2_9BACT